MTDTTANPAERRLPMTRDAEANLPARRGLPRRLAPGEYPPFQALFGEGGLYERLEAGPSDTAICGYCGETVAIEDVGDHHARHSDADPAVREQVIVFDDLRPAEQAADPGNTETRGSTMTDPARDGLDAGRADVRLRRRGL